MRAKLRSLRKDRRGMTLVEIMVTLLILSIMLGIAGSILLSSSRFYQNSVATDLDKLTADNLYRTVTEELLYATRITVSDSPLAGMDGCRVFSIRDGRLYWDGSDAYGESYYHHRQLEMEAAVLSDYQFSLTFRLKSGGTSLYETGSVLEALNVKLEQERGASGIQGNIGQTYTKGYIYYDYNRTAASTTTGTTVPPTPVVPGGTVADEALYTSGKVPYFNRYATYRYGDFVISTDPDTGEPGLYRCLPVPLSGTFRASDKFWAGEETDYFDPGGGGGFQYWKRIQLEFTLQSSYEERDIIQHEGAYYQARSYINTFYGTFDQMIERGFFYEVRRDDSLGWTMLDPDTGQWVKAPERDWPPLPGT